MEITNEYQKIQTRTYIVKLQSYYVPFILYVGIGIVLGLDYFINEIKKNGKVKIYLPKVIFMVLPSLYFSLANILNFFDNHFISNVLYYPARYLILYNGGNFVVNIFQLILGYSIITSIYKDRNEITG